MVCQSIIHKSYAEQIMASCQDDDDHCPMMALDELNKTVSRQMVLGTFSDLIKTTTLVIMRVITLECGYMIIQEI